MTAQYLSGAAHAASPPVKACTSDCEPWDQLENACALQNDISAYLDGELQGNKLAALEALLSKNADFRRDVNTIRRTEQLLKQIGAEILLEPVPPFLLDVLSARARD